MKKVFSILIVLVFVFPVSISLAMGDSDPENPRKHEPGGSKTPIDIYTCSNIEEMSSTVTLYGNFEEPPGRSTNADYPAMPNLWTSVGATTSSDNSKYYLVVKVTSSECGLYNKTYVLSTPGDLSIKVPKGISYRVKVDYREQCGAFYGLSNYKTTVWRWEKKLL